MTEPMSAEVKVSSKPELVEKLQQYEESIEYGEFSFESYRTKAVTHRTGNIDGLMGEHDADFYLGVERSKEPEPIESDLSLREDLNSLLPEEQELDMTGIGVDPDKIVEDTGKTTCSEGISAEGSITCYETGRAAHVLQDAVSLLQDRPDLGALDYHFRLSSGSITGETAEEAVNMLEDNIHVEALVSDSVSTYTISANGLGELDVSLQGTTPDYWEGEQWYDDVCDTLETRYDVNREDLSNAFILKL